MIPTLWVIATLTFFMMRLAPGGPFLSEREIPPSALEQLKHCHAGEHRQHKHDALELTCSKHDQSRPRT